MKPVLVVLSIFVTPQKYLLGKAPVKIVNTEYLVYVKCQE